MQPYRDAKPGSDTEGLMGRGQEQTFSKTEVGGQIAGIIGYDLRCTRIW
jgi:hypothetical protein